MWWPTCNRPVALIAVSLALAGCTTAKVAPKATQPHISTSTTAQPTGTINGAFNINANWESSGKTVPGGTALICSGTGDAAPLTVGSTVYISTTHGERGNQTTPLGQGISDTASNLSLPGKTIAGSFEPPQICQFGVDVRGLTLAPTYYLTVVSSSGQATSQFTVRRHLGGNQLPFETTVDPETVAATTTTTTPPPTTTTTPIFTVTGTGPADITIDEGGQEVQNNDVSLPWSSNGPITGPCFGFVSMDAQTEDGSDSATISCSILGGPPNTSTGPYSVVTCSGDG